MSRLLILVIFCSINEFLMKNSIYTKTNWNNRKYNYILIIMLLIIYINLIKYLLYIVHILNR